MNIQRRILNRAINPQEKESWARFLFELDLQIDDICRRLNHSQAAAPVTGTWQVADRVYNSAPAIGQYAGWICTVAGSPGTWRPFGLIA